VVHIHESGILGLLIAFWVRRMVPRARIIFDYHDWIPSEIASSVRGIRPLYAPAMAASMPLMRFLARAVDVAVCISPGQAEWTREALGIAQTRVIQNVRPLMAAPDLGGAEFRPELLFAGNVMRIRRLEFVVDVVAMLRVRGVETLLSICGDFTEPDYVQELRERVTRSGLDELVRFHGRYRGDEELGRIAGRGAVGITMGLEERVDTRVNRIASANKLFSYLALGLPVLVEESYENMLRIVEEGAAGASFRTCEECADAASWIWRTPKAWEEMRENALRLTRRMNAATYAGVLEELYA
jgi:glycosyltransferase involved in cell wall biosynthesis